MSFALMKTLTNASVLNLLADVMVRLGDAAADVPGIFNNPSAVDNLGQGMANTGPSVTVASSAVPADPDQLPVLVDGVAYTVIGDAPDGTGLTRLTLECTA